VREEIAVAMEQLVAELRKLGGTTSAKYLTTSEAAARAGVTSATIRDWIRQKRLPKHSVGRAWRVRASDLEDLLAAPQDDVAKAVVLELRRIGIEDK